MWQGLAHSATPGHVFLGELRKSAKQGGDIAARNTTESHSSRVVEMVCFTTVQKIGRHRSKGNHCSNLLPLTVAKTMTKSNWEGRECLTLQLTVFTEGRQSNNLEAGAEQGP